jgi:hypothetical protein
LKPLNRHVKISSPFPEDQLPALFVWTDKARETFVDDTVPANMFEFVKWHRDRTQILRDGSIQTWQVLRDGELGGYIESVSAYDTSVSFPDALNAIAYCRFVFKREFWPWRTSKTALNLALKDIFDSGIETAFFRGFAHTRAILDLYRDVGMRDIGRIAPAEQQGAPVECKLFACSAVQWGIDNAEFVQAVAEVA